MHGLLDFSKSSSGAFTEDGFNNWKKATERITSHESSISQREVKVKWSSLSKPSIAEHLNSQRRNLQSTRREAFLLQLSGLKYLLRQGLALCGYNEVEGNLN